jgi:hypothetical protein
MPTIVIVVLLAALAWLLFGCLKPSFAVTATDCPPNSVNWMLFYYDPVKKTFVGDKKWYAVTDAIFFVGVNAVDRSTGNQGYLSAFMENGLGSVSSQYASQPFIPKAGAYRFSIQSGEVK